MNELKIDGMAKIYLNNEEIRSIHNTWAWGGFYRVMILLYGGADGENIGGGTLRHIVDSGLDYLDTNLIKTVTTNVLKIEGERGYPTGSTLVYLTLVGGKSDALLTDWTSISFSPPLTIPSGWTLRTEWSNTFSGTDYSSSYLNRICNQLNSSTINSTFPPYSISIVHSTGEAFCPTSETIATSDAGKSVVIYKGSFITGTAYTNIGTIRTYRDIQYSSTTISLFNKPTDVELHIEHRNTITQ